VSESIRLFFGLWPDYSQRDRLRDVISPATRLIDGRAVPRDNWHVTILFLGETPNALLPALLAAADELQPAEAFEMRFDRVEFWARSRTAVLVPATLPSELARLNQLLKTRVGELGHPTEDLQFRPHITVCRTARPFETQRLARSAAIQWSRFELLESRNSRGELSYHPLKQELRE
jgi:2'-5' RNA ligase